MAHASLLADILVAKYADHQPLYRQSEIAARDRVRLDLASMGRWVGQCETLLAPLVEALRRYAMAAGKLHADDTPIPVVAPGNKQTKTGRLWVYVRDDRRAGAKEPAAVWFAYSPNRQGVHPQHHLAGFKGALQADAYAGFNELFADGTIREAACMAHARRKFYDIHVRTLSETTQRALHYIGELYGIEANIRGKPAGDPAPSLQLRRPHHLAPARHRLPGRAQVVGDEVQQFRRTAVALVGHCYPVQLALQPARVGAVDTAVDSIITFLKFAHKFSI